jgi:hypothetical protein
MRVHPVIRVAYLMLYECGDDSFERIPPPPGPVEYGSDDAGSQEEYELSEWLIRRYLMRWKGYGPRTIRRCRRRSWGRLMAWSRSARSVSDAPDDSDASRE